MFQGWGLRTANCAPSHYTPGQSIPRTNFAHWASCYQWEKRRNLIDDANAIECYGFIHNWRHIHSDECFQFHDTNNCGKNLNVEKGCI